MTRAIEREAEKCAEARLLRTHPGVGALTALAFVLILGDAEYHSLTPKTAKEKRKVMNA